MTSIIYANSYSQLGTFFFKRLHLSKMQYCVKYIIGYTQLHSTRVYLLLPTSTYQDIPTYIVLGHIYIYLHRLGYTQLYLPTHLVYLLVPGSARIYPTVPNQSQDISTCTYVRSVEFHCFYQVSTVTSQSTLTPLLFCIVPFIDFVNCFIIT